MSRGDRLLGKATRICSRTNIQVVCFGVARATSLSRLEGNICVLG